MGFILNEEFWMLDFRLGNGEADVGFWMVGQGKRRADFGWWILNFGLAGERDVGCWFQFKIQHPKLKNSARFGQVGSECNSKSIIQNSKI